MLAWLLMIIRRGNGRPEETAIMERARLVWSKIGPAAASVALLILLWMMQHVEQVLLPSMEGFSRLRYFQWFWSPVPFLSDLGCRICWCSNHLMWPADIHTAFTCGIGLYGCSPRPMFPQWGARHLGWMLLITLALTACCTAMSWKLVEQPVARGGFIA